MKTRPFLLTIAGIALLTGLVGCSPRGGDTDKESQESSPAESRVKAGPNGQIIVTLDAQTQKLMGLQLTNLPASQLSPEVKGYGHVLDASPLAALVTEQSAAQANSDASTAELKRMKTLAASDNASASALQTAEADAARDRAQVESIRQQLLAGWGSAIAKQQDLPEFAQSLLSLESALVEITLPAGESLESPPTGARLIALAGETNPIEAQYVGPLPLVDPQMQGQAFLFLVKSNSLRVTPGAAVTGWMSVPGETAKGVVVPESAIVRYQEKAWIYVTADGTNFLRQEVTLDRPVVNGWFITLGLQPGEGAVVSGAEVLLSEELKSQTPLED